jgi:hypothetical protein
MYETSAEITAGVEERDRACDRTLKRSLFRSGHSPIRFVADPSVGVVDAGGSELAAPNRRVIGSFDAESLEVTYNLSMLILIHILKHCHLSCRMQSFPYVVHWCASYLFGRKICHEP